jgi:hypothetical protein
VNARRGEDNSETTKSSGDQETREERIEQEDQKIKSSREECLMWGPITPRMRRSAHHQTPNVDVALVSPLDLSIFLFDPSSVEATQTTLPAQSNP